MTAADLIWPGIAVLIERRRQRGLTPSDEIDERHDRSGVSPGGEVSRGADGRDNSVDPAGTDAATAAARRARPAAGFTGSESGPG